MWVREQTKKKINLDQKTNLGLNANQDQWFKFSEHWHNWIFVLSLKIILFNPFATTAYQHIIVDSGNIDAYMRHWKRQG